MEGSSVASFTDASITYNVATYGAGIYTSGSVALSFVRATIGHNTYYRTVGAYTYYGLYRYRYVYYYRYTRYGRYYTTWTYGYNTYSYAGGLWASSGSTMDIQGSTIEANDAYSTYGGLYLAYSTATISDTSFSENYARTNGGGLYTSYGNTIITDSSFNNNRAGSHGGGLYTDYGTTSMIRTSFTSNSGTYGAGYYMNGGTTAMAAHIFLGNSGTFGYSDMHRASGTLTIEMGCPEHQHNFGKNLLDCVSCSSIHYPKDLSFDDCRPWTAHKYASTQSELEAAIIFDSTVELLADVSLSYAIAVLGFEQLTGVIIDGAGLYEVTINFLHNLKKNRVYLDFLDDSQIQRLNDSNLL